MSEKEYESAVNWLSGSPAAASLPTESKLELYGIFKFLSTSGPPTTPRPGMFAFEAKAKYDAWVAASSKYAGDESGARERYVAIAESVGFTPGDGGRSGMGPSVSVMVAEDEPEGISSEVHDAATAGAVNDLKAILLLDPAQLNAKDEFGFTPLHLAADRGHAPAVAYLLSLGADKCILDPDEQTALEIATVSGRDDVVELLK